MITPVIKTAFGIRLQTNIREIIPVTTYLQEYSTGILRWSCTKNDVKLLQINDDIDSSEEEELMSTQPGIKILILPVNNRDFLSKLSVTGHTLELIVFMPESGIVSWASRKATRPIIK
jgi:hypothetical protein